MIISTKQLIRLQGGIENNFTRRLKSFAKENLGKFNELNNGQQLQLINKVLELSKEYKITSEINIVRFMIIYFEKNIKIPFEQPVKTILLNPKWDENRRIEELLFLTYSDLIGLKEIGIQNQNLK